MILESIRKKNPLIFLLTLFLFILSCKKADNTSRVTTVPIPPTDLNATVVSTTQINLNWIDKSTNELGFKLERKTPNSNFAVIATLGADITSYSDNGVSPSTTYTYRVYSYNSVGASPTYSNEVTVSTIGLPSITTTVVSNITAIDGISGGTITADGGSAVSTRGLVWSTSQNPTITLSTKTTDGSGTGTFSSKITGLSPMTKYFVRAYATNAAGTAYGNEISFTTTNIDISTGLLAFYPFTGNAGDSSGNNYHGIVDNSTLTLSTDRKGISNSAYQFSGSNKITIPLTQTNISNYTICAWFKTNAGGTIIGGRGSSGAGLSLRIQTNQTYRGRLIWVNDNDKGEVGQMTNAQHLDNNWHFVVGTFSSSGQLIAPNNFNIYIDGVLVNSETVNSSTPTPTSPINNNTFMLIGSRNNYEFFNGILDDIRIYNRVLTQQEITFLANR